MATSLYSVDPDLVLSHKFPESTFSYTERDVALYNLGIGACGEDAVDEKELKYVYHEDGQRFIHALPTFGASFPYWNAQGVENVQGLKFDPSLLLHGQQYMEIYKPFPSKSCVINKAAVTGLHDKGKATMIEIETTSYEKVSGEALCMNRSTIYLRGVGGFSKSNKPYSYSNYPPGQVSPVKIPSRKPSKIYENKTQHSQALLYRLSGDYNPLHSDPKIANIAGFNRPILHGLCTYGFVVRAVIKVYGNGDPTTVKSVFGRFLAPVYPGETLITQMWLEGSRIIYEAKVKERDRAVLSGYVVLKNIRSPL